MIGYALQAQDPENKAIFIGVVKKRILDCRCISVDVDPSELLPDGLRVYIGLGDDRQDVREIMKECEEP